MREVKLVKLTLDNLTLFLTIKMSNVGTTNYKYFMLQISNVNENLTITKRNLILIINKTLLIQFKKRVLRGRP